MSGIVSIVHPKTTLNREKLISVSEGLVFGLLVCAFEYPYSNLLSADGIVVANLFRLYCLRLSSSSFYCCCSLLTFITSQMDGRLREK